MQNSGITFSILLIVTLPTVVGSAIVAIILARNYSVSVLSLMLRSLVSIIFGLVGGAVVGWTIGYLIGALIGLLVGLLKPKYSIRE